MLYAGAVWHSMGEFLLKLHAQGLGHEAVIEIMIALLGVMIAVLTLFVAVLSVFGFVVIRREARKNAAKIAKETATEMMKEEIRKWQGLVMAFDQPRPASRRNAPVTSGRKTTDAGLKRGKSK